MKADFTLGIGHYTNVNAKKGLAIGSYNTLSDKATESGVFGQGQYGKLPSMQVVPIALVTITTSLGTTPSSWVIM